MTIELNTPVRDFNLERSAAAVAARNHSIDAFRVIANWVIICVHTMPFMAPAFDPDVRFLGELLNQFVRVATPFFFLAAGYFFSVSLSRGAEPVPLATKLIRRLMLFFAFWSFVYVFAPIDILLQNPGIGYWHAVRTMVWRSTSMHLSFFVNGPKYHLWFLPALSCSLALLATACRFRLERVLYSLAAGLFLFGLIAGAYKATPIGLDLGINTRNGPFFSTIFVVTGFAMHRLRLRVSLQQALGLIGLGIALRVGELYWVTGSYGTPPSDIDYLLGTYPFGVGIFMLLLTTKRLGEVKWMVALSRYSGGIYCAHMLIVELLAANIFPAGPAWWEISRPFIGLALTAGLVMSLARIPALRPVTT